MCPGARSHKTRGPLPKSILRLLTGPHGGSFHPSLGGYPPSYPSLSALPTSPSLCSSAGPWPGDHLIFVPSVPLPGTPSRPHHYSKFLPVLWAQSITRPVPGSPPQAQSWGQGEEIFPTSTLPHDTGHTDDNPRVLSLQGGWADGWVVKTFLLGPNGTWFTWVKGKWD